MTEQIRAVFEGQLQYNEQIQAKLDTDVEDYKKILKEELSYGLTSDSMLGHYVQFFLTLNDRSKYNLKRMIEIHEKYKEALWKLIEEIPETETKIEELKELIDFAEATNEKLLVEVQLKDQLLKAKKLLKEKKIPEYSVEQIKEKKKAILEIIDKYNEAWKKGDGKKAFQLKGQMGVVHRQNPELKKFADEEFEKRRLGKLSEIGFSPKLLGGR